MEIVDRVIAGSIAAILGAFSAYLFNRLNWKETSKKNSILSIESELIESLNSLADSALEYWSYNQADLKNSKLLEAKIKMRFSSLNPLFQQLTFIHGSFTCGESLKITNEIEQLFEHVTDGNFESKKRNASPKKCLKISNSCNKIKINIRKVIHS
ncbi:hypothetical protein H5123_07590 [Shewanella sp. SR43-4]|uniref:hypothetical protein n=1 Tax=unclassified Shewanella TaxID=196818 RepID=UPI0015FBB38E|nr:MULTISPECIES: hypothetical protein [unclassified Shewanella]MBB1317501.1 hypothetical protein [Shewanella sp. SR43-4]MBB1387979.1 hypothetical protein [Shewanella sp. SG44-6]